MNTPYLDAAIELHKKAKEIGKLSKGGDQALAEFKAIKQALNIGVDSESLCTCNYAGSRGEKQCNHCIKQREENEF